MSVDRVRQYLKQFGAQDRIMEFAQSSATVELAAQAVGVDAARIAKSLSFESESGCLLIVAAGDARIDNSAFKAQFGRKARMLTPERALELTGYAVGGVCPFDVNADAVEVWLDESLRRFGTVFPACGSSNSAIELTTEELERFSHARGWVNVCKSWQGTYPRVIDMHAHIFPDAIAERTMDKLVQVADGLKPVVLPTLAATTRHMKNSAISAFAALPIATKPSQCVSINNWVAAASDDYVLGFGTIHPDFEDVPGELERIKALGLHGIKLHPDYQGFFPDDERMFPIYEKLAELGLPVVMHAGWDPVSPELTRCTPERLRHVIDRVPGLRLIAAHMGGMKMSDDVLRYLAGQDIYFDTSMSHVYLTTERLRELIDAHGPQRILFGSDCPWSMASRQIQMLREAGFEGDVLDGILYRNAAELLGLDD